MLRRASLAFAALLFLIPGNLLAAAMASGASCAERGCCCAATPVPDKPVHPGKSWAAKCCCETPPAPEDRPTDPAQTPKEVRASGIDLPAVAVVMPSCGSPRERIGEQPAHTAQAPPDPLFIRYHNLRL